jgi:hypothetical protein
MLTMARLTAALALLAVAILPSSAAAGIWTPVDSGTTDEITAIDYRADAMRYVTATGKIFKRTGTAAGAQEASFPGRQFSDVAMSPDGTKGLATADSGKLFRFSGGAWSEVSLANTTYDHECGGSGDPLPRDQAPTANLLAVEWASNDIAWVVSAARGQILKSTDGGATFADASRTANRTCQVNQNVTDVAPIPGSTGDVYFVDQNFATVWRTSDALVSAAQQRENLVNCFDVVMRVAVDPASPNRVSAAGVCESTLHWGFTADAGTSKNYTDSTGGKVRDLAGEAGLFIAVGDAGKIEQTFDGKTVFGQPADGALATKDWRAVDFLDASRAAVGGVTGSLVVSDRANEKPDVVAPTVAINGPATVQAGAPASFTANATDNPGGVGIDPAGFQWTGNGLTPTTAGTATYTFASTGTFTVRVKARDLRGNVSEEATLVVTVVAPVFVISEGTKPPLVGGAARKKGRFVTLRVKGKLKIPAGLTAAQACKGQVFIRVLKGKKLLVARVAKVSSKCGYTKTIRIARSKVGKAKKLTLVIGFSGSSSVGASQKKYTVKVK